MVRAKDHDVTPTWWVSFSLVGKGALGVAIVDAPAKCSAVQTCRDLGLYPSEANDVEVMRIDPHGEDTKNFPKNTFITVDQLRAKSYEKKTTHRPINHGHVH